MGLRKREGGRERDRMKCKRNKLDIWGRER